MKILLSAFFWISVYLLLVLAPLAVLKMGEVPPGSGFWWDFSMALGFAGMAMMGVQFFVTARFRRASAPFGVDIIYYFHRYLAVMAFAFIFLHFVIIRIDNVDALGAINPLQAPWYMTVGRLALVLLALLIATSLWRKPLRIPYEGWRLLHIALAVTAFLLAIGHIAGVGYYIEAPVKRWLWTGYTLFWLLLIVYLRLFKPWRMSKRPYRVTEVSQERGNSCTLTLQPDGHDGMRFKPGQFAWLTLGDSPWHIKEHPFSFSSSAARQDQLTFTIKALGDFTRGVKHTKVGKLAYLDGPHGVFSVDQHPHAPGFVFIAGGIGAAPIVSMLHTLADRHEHRPLWFVYGSDNWDDIIFREQLASLKQRLNLQLIHVLKQPPQDWQGETGFITPALLQRVLPAETQQYEYFLCGPRRMSNTVQQALHAQRVPLAHIHFELFDMV